MKKTVFLFSALLATTAQAQFNDSAEVVYVDHRYTSVDNRTPVQQCSTVDVPVYKTTTQQGGDDIVSFIVGGAIGSAVGNQISSANGAGAIGAIVGGALANEHQKKHNTRETNEIVGYRQVQKCSTQYQVETTQQYRYSRVIVEYNGNRIKLNRKNPNISVGDYINVDVTVK